MMISSSPEFSVVIPVRNGANYIAIAIESVLNQTYQHFNILILENCSQDNTLDIIRSFPDPRIQVFPAKTSLSIEDNWGRILDLKMNEYLVLLCHDDYLYPGFLQEIVNLIESEPGATLYHTSFHFVDGEGRMLRAGPPVAYSETADEFLYKLHQFKEDVFGSGFVMRSMDFKLVGGYPKFFKLLFADLLCYYHLSVLGYKVCSPKPLYAFRRHSESVGHQAHPREFVEPARQYLAALAKTEHFQSPDGRALAERFMRVFLWNRYRLFLHKLTKARETERLNELNDVKHYFVQLAKTDPVYNINTFSLQVYEFVARIPWWLPRIALFRLANVVAIIRKKISIHLQTNIAGAENP